jgi:hypothetical protein
LLIKDAIWDGTLFDKKVKIETIDGWLGYTVDFSKNDCRIEIPKSVFSAHAETDSDDKKISSVEFCSKYTISKEDIDALEELEDSILDILDSLHFQTLDVKKIKQINNLLYKYASALVYYFELSKLSNALLDLTRQIDASMESEKIAEFGASMFLLEGLIANLKDWRTKVFVEQSAKDINYLDSSFQADCEQIFGNLNGNDNQEDEGELELF